MGYSVLNNTKSGQLLIVNGNTTSNVTTEISYYRQCGCCTNDTGIKIASYRHSYKFELKLSYIELNMHAHIRVYLSCKGHNFIKLKGLTLVGTTFSKSIIQMQPADCVGTAESYDNKLNKIIQFVDCHFAFISGTSVIIYI